MPRQAGRIPGGFFKREGRPSEKEIITCRLIDRPLRPLFPEGYTHETQIISLVISADGENDSDILGINGASTALVLSDIPYYNPLGAVRVALIEGEMVFNPTNSLRDVADLDLVVVTTEQAIVMVEAAANQLSEQVILDCIFAAQQEAQKIILAQHEMFREMRLEKPDWKSPEPYPQELYDTIRASAWDDFLAAPEHTRQVRPQGRRRQGGQGEPREPPRKRRGGARQRQEESSRYSRKKPSATRSSR